MKNNRKISKSPISVYEAITSYYSDLMKIANREYGKIHGYNDVDYYRDIAHDTLLKMCDMFSNVNVTELLIKNYFCKAVRMNYLRELVTADSKRRERLENEDISLVGFNNENKIDYDVILEDIKSKFKENDCNIFINFYNGYTLKELNNKYNINNSDYIIRKIKEYIKKKYSGYDLKKKKKYRKLQGR